MSRDPKSPLLKKRALDALLDSMADGLDHDNYDELGAHSRGEPWLPEGKGTELDSTQDVGERVIIPPADLTPPSGVEDAEFFKESQPKQGTVVHRSSPESDLGTQPIDDLIQEVQGDVDNVAAKEAAVNPVEEEIEGHEFFKQAPDEAMFAAVADKLGIKYKGMLNDVPSYRLVHFTDPVTGTGIDVPLDEFTEDKVKEHLNAARERFNQPKIAGHRVKDTGIYDESKEARIRKIAQETAQYYERGPKFDPKGEYLCGGCHYMLGNKACAFVEGDDISKEHGTCRYWKIADGKAPVELERKYNKKDAGYAVRNDQPFGCSRCEYGFEANEADSAGRDMWCEFFGMHIDANACCNENNLHGDIHFNVDNSKQANFVALAELTKSAGKTLYHVTNTDKVAKIKAEGILPLQTSNWVKGPEGERYGEGEIFAMDNPVDAIRWAAKMDWEFNQKMGSGNISIITFTSGVEKWKTDSSDPISQGQNKGKWLKAIGSVKPQQITGSHVLTPDMVKSVVQGKDVKLGEEKTADVPTKSYGMGTPIGGTDNPDAGAEDDPEEGVAGEESMDMTSSLDEDDERIYAMLDEEDERSERMDTAAAKRLDNAPFAVAAFKIASMDDAGWFWKSARPSEQKLELLQKQFKMTPEQLEEAIKTDPSPNQSDYVAWLVKWWAKGNIHLPEDSQRMREQLEMFQKFKKSPMFTFTKDIQQYDPVKLFETLEIATSSGMSSKKEEKREVVNKGATVVVQEGDIKIYKITTPEAAKELGGGTNWCTAAPGTDYAENYLKQGPMYIFFDAGSAVAQLHPESNQFMNRLDVCMLEPVRGEEGRNDEKFLADPGLAKALGLLAEKEPSVKSWVAANVSDPEAIKNILGEAAAQEVTHNTEFEKEMVQYEQDMVEYQQKMEVYTPKAERWGKKYDVYREKLDAWYKKQQSGEDAGERPKEPAGRPEQPRQPINPGVDRYNSGYGYGYNRYNEPRGKKFKNQVRNALATGVPLPPEIEQQLVGANINTDLLLKYAALFHPGQPWEPLAALIFAKVKEKGVVNKEAVDYAAKFIKGRWPELEPYLLSKLFLVTKNMENMRTALDYAIRVYKQRWPEFEKKIQTAKPGAASGYGAAEYAIGVLKKPWSAFPDIKRKKNGKINAEECMIVGNPGEARKYAEAFNAGKKWDAFEESALAANNLAALINYAADTLKTRMPALEEKILSGEKDTQESKGRRRYREHTDLALDYSLKVVKGRWPEYEQKILTHMAGDKAKAEGYSSSSEYKPSHGNRGYYGYGHSSRLPETIANYIEQVIKGRWPELEQTLLARYQQHPATWVTNQNLVDGYLTTINRVCADSKKDNSPEEEEETFETGESDALGPITEKVKPDERTQKPFSKFTEDPSCWWKEGEQRLVTRDPGYEETIVAHLRERTNDKEWNEKNKAKFVSPEDLAKMERPDREQVNWEYRDKQPDHTVWNGIWIGYYGMDEVEKYTDYMLANGQTWQLGVDIMELHEDIEDIRGRYTHMDRPPRRQKSLQFQSSLLKKKALIDIEPAPSLLPPRDDLKGHMDEQMHDQLTKEVMKGVREPLNPKKKNRRPQINPNINPDGVVAADHRYVSPQERSEPRTKTAEYTEQDAEDDGTTELWLDQMEDSQDEARRHFMQEDYLQQIAQDNGVTMEALWDDMGEEYTAEFYGYPYRRVPDFTNEETKGLDKGDGQELRLPG